jgi:hypothetical protein
LAQSESQQIVGALVLDFARTESMEAKLLLLRPKSEMLSD